MSYLQSFIIGILLAGAAQEGFLMGQLIRLNHTLADIRTISSESRDTLNCIQTPNDPTCL